jgi:hypothetical protein
VASDSRIGAEGSGVLLLRAWLHDGQVIARVQSFISAEEDQRGQVAVGTDQIAAAVRRWLEDLAETQR